MIRFGIQNQRNVGCPLHRRHKQLWEKNIRKKFTNCHLKIVGLDKYFRVVLSVIISLYIQSETELISCPTCKELTIVTLCLMAQCAIQVSFWEHFSACSTARTMLGLLRDHLLVTLPVSVTWYTGWLNDWRTGCLKEWLTDLLTPLVTSWKFHTF